MTIYADVIAAYPELESTDNFTNGTIILQNDSDGLGDYIAKWDYIKPIPQGMKLGK
jgi:hypothetical protein